jgi:hypothetical protein
VAFEGHDMKVIADDMVGLANFPLLWRWTQETHAKFARDELASIRPVRPAKAATVCAQFLSCGIKMSAVTDRVDANGETAGDVVKSWLEERLPGGEKDVLLIWDRDTAAVVPRRLFVHRWDDFWYPSSDDLLVTGTIGTWWIEMRHDGLFEFSAGGAVEQPDAMDSR